MLGACSMTRAAAGPEWPQRGRRSRAFTLRSGESVEARYGVDVVASAEFYNAIGTLIDSVPESERLALVVRLALRHDGEAVPGTGSDARFAFGLMLALMLSRTQQGL